MNSRVAEQFARLQVEKLLAPKDAEIARLRAALQRYTKCQHNTPLCHCTTAAKGALVPLSDEVLAERQRIEAHRGLPGPPIGNQNWKGKNGGTK